MVFILYVTCKSVYTDNAYEQNTLRNYMFKASFKQRFTSKSRNLFINYMNA